MAAPSRGRSKNTSPHLSPDIYDSLYNPMELDDYPSEHQSRSSRPRSISPAQSWIGEVGAHSVGHYTAMSDVSVEDDDKKPRKSMQTPSVYSLNRLRTDVDTERLVERRAREIAKWHIHWVTPVLMVLLLILGIIGAISHHVFYQSLDGKPAENQLWMVRYGTALAFFTKATLVGSVILSYRQRIWHTFRTKAMTMGTIDGLFASTEDPSQYFRWEMIKNAKLAVVMSMGSWLIPIASLLSPASLTTGITPITNATICPSVPDLSFRREGTYDFRNPAQRDSKSLIYMNSTDVDMKTDGWFDYYDQPHKNTKRLINTATYLKRPVGAPITPENCGSGWNCTYEVHLWAPGFKCDMIASGDDGNDDNSRKDALFKAGVPFGFDLLAPKGENVYFANVDTADYQRTQSNGTFLSNIPQDLGVLKTEPPLYIGYALNTTEAYDDDSEFAEKWKTVHIPKIFKCDHYVTDYTVSVNYTDGTQHSNITQRDFKWPVINTTITRSDPNDLDKYDISPESGWVRPTGDLELYKRISSYHALGQLLRGFLRGRLFIKTTYPQTESDLTETKLSNVSTSYPVDDLMEAVQSLYEDMILTLLSEPLVITSPSQVDCKKTQYRNLFHYQQEGLWIGYAAVIALTLVFLLIGFWSMWSNGVASDTLFSRILVTCRNPTLDRLSVGACLGSDPFPIELAKTKLRFGVLIEDGEAEDTRFERLFGKVEHACFGTVGETNPIKKGNTYAGLKRWRNERAADEEKEALRRIEEDEEKDVE